MKKTSYTSRNKTFLPHILKKCYFVFRSILRIFIFLCFRFFSFLFLLVFISSNFFSSCLHVSLDVFIVFVYFTVSSFLCCYSECYGLREGLLLSDVFLTYTPVCFDHLFAGASSSALKVLGIPIEVRSTDPAHLFV